MAVPAPTAAAAGGSAAPAASPPAQSENTAASATFYAVAGGGSDITWRVRWPARFLRANTCLISPDQEKVFQAPHDFDPFPWSATDTGEFTWPSHEGAAIWTRPDLIRARHIFAMQEHGILTLAEADDNYLSAPHLNLFMRINNYGAAGRTDHLKAMAVADRVVFSTDWLRDRYRKAFKHELGHVPDLFVCRNHVDLTDWPERDEGDGRLRIGWMGSPQHARDIQHAADAMAWARSVGHDVVVMGQDIRDESRVTHPLAREVCRAWRQIITRHIPWIDPAHYHRTALPFDIGLAPLELNDHTFGKSDIKAVEYAMSGAVPVLQNHPVYAKEWRHNETCLLAGSPAEFEWCVRQLAHSRSLRERLVTAAQQYVKEYRSNAVATKEWEAAIA